MSEVMLLAMMGVSTTKTIALATRGAEKVINTHPYSKFQEAVKKSPPEVHAMLMAGTLGSLKQLVVCSVNEAIHLRAIGEETPASEATRMAYLNDLIDRFERVAVSIRDACARRAAAGWPEWDYEKGCPVGEEPQAPEQPVDLGGLLSGIDLSWLDDEEVSA